ncbi:pyridoxamine 5'-phosphate oxidase family protein [Microbacterium sp. B35-30]|uniref:pyridoxamine 5'-phosphate oxidase family protein n=1 Tax=Microbacterium sp. B35-30 TaxID=1962642 RepID=UPI0013D00751|nr:pyridoxamine 5'-phosphate oxidase family protein [Microbacterium sp. B35-30]KAF2415700.1 pyridoxamine 5-phosphate oxidase [Microbacterium sp. B35-30]
MDSNQDSAVLAMTTDECWNLLARRELGRLATSVDDVPDIFPVNYVVDGPSVLFRTAPGSKLAEISANRQVAFEVDEYDDAQAASVVIKGTARRLETQSEIDAADALGLVSWAPTLKYRWVRISAHTVSGRRFARALEPDRYRASDVDDRN